MRAFQSEKQYEKSLKISSRAEYIDTKSVYVYTETKTGVTIYIL